MSNGTNVLRRAVQHRSSRGDAGIRIDDARQPIVVGILRPRFPLLILKSSRLKGIDPM